jgi:hypothetical protein
MKKNKFSGKIRGKRGFNWMRALKKENNNKIFKKSRKWKK